MPRPDPADVHKLRDVLERARVQRRTLTYLEAADALDLVPPHRIHKTARLVERLLSEDAAAGRPPLAALVVSKARGGLPAPGFFDRARRLGLYAGGDPAAFHQRLLVRLFDETEITE
jgi:hypothetical protein